MGNKTSKKEKKSSLHSASIQGDHTMIKLLLDNKKCLINEIDINGESSLHVACEYGHTLICSLLIERNASINIQSNNGTTPLMIASRNGYTSICQTLIKNNANINLQDDNGYTSLSLAAQYASAYIVRLLIEADADPNIHDNDNITPLMYAVSTCPIETVELLIEHKAEVNARNHNGQTPLICCASKAQSTELLPGTSSVIDLLIRCGSDIDAKNHDRYTALMVSVHHGHYAVCERLLISGANVNHIALCGVSSLMLASSQGHNSITELLIKWRANIDHVDDLRQTALMKASQNGHAYIVEKLCMSKCDINIRDTNGESALSKACQNKNVSVIQVFSKLCALDNLMALLSSTNHHGDTPLIIASRCGHPHLVKLLLSMKANVNVSNRQGRNALHVAVSVPNFNGTIFHLIKAQSNVNNIDNDGFAVLPTAIQIGIKLSKNSNNSSQYKWFLKSIQAMIQASADINLIDARGLSSLDLAHQQEDIYNILTNVNNNLDIKTWNVKHVSQWLKSIDLSMYIDNFMGVDGELLIEILNDPNLLDNELKINNKLHKMKLIREIKKLTQKSVMNLPTPTTSEEKKYEEKYENINGNSDYDRPFVKRKKEKIQERYEIAYESIALSREVGKGAFGKVYLGFWRGAKVAVKQLHSQNLSETQLLEFKREAVLLEKLGNHPYIVRYLGICPSPICIVTQFYENGSVESILKKGKFNVNLALINRWAKETCSAMIHLTKEGLIHRDLAARNLLVDENLSVRVTDFGMAKLKSNVHNWEKDANTSSPMYSVPIKWMAPEAIVHGKFSEKSDVFSFGVTLWEMVTHGCSPYEGLGNYEVACGIANNDSKYRLQVPNDIPLEMKRLMEDCWNYEAQRRPTFEEIFQRLEEFSKIIIDDEKKIQ